MAWGGQLGLAPLSSCRSGYCFCRLNTTSESIFMLPEDNMCTAALAGLISSACLPKAVNDREEGVGSAADSMAMVTSSCPFPHQSVSQDKLLMLGACSPKLAAGTRLMHPSSLSRVKRRCLQYFMKLHDFNMCKHLPLFLFFWGLITRDCSKPQAKLMLSWTQAVNCCWWQFLGLLNGCREPSIFLVASEEILLFSCWCPLKIMDLTKKWK